MAVTIQIAKYKFLQYQWRAISPNKYSPKSYPLYLMVFVDCALVEQRAKAEGLCEAQSPILAQ
jgi:hypothetical protein